MAASSRSGCIQVQRRLGPHLVRYRTDTTRRPLRDLGSLSWAASQRTLAFNWGPGQTTSLRLLNLDTAGGSLRHASLLALTLANTAGMGQTLYQCRVMSVTPDGSAIV